jgi:hypothetical protein
MALGPRLHIGGTDTGLPLPYALLYGKLPFLTNFRAPNRFAVMLALALCVLAALSFTTLFEYLQKRLTPPFRAKQGFVLPAVVSAFLMVLYVLESIVFSWPLQTAEAKVPEIYRQIAAEPGDFLVMDLPLAPLSAPLYYQTIYQKPLVGGYPSRISNRMSLSFDKVPYFSMFNPAESSAVMDGSAARGQPDIFPVEISFKQALQQNNIRYVLLRNYQGGRRFFVWIKPFVETNLGAPIYQNEDASLLAWRVEPSNTTLPAPASGVYRVHVGDGWNAGLGKGEDRRLLRLAEQDAQLLIEAGSAGPANLHLKLTPYIRPQTIEVRLNGQVAGRIEGPKEWKAVESTLSNLPFKAGQNLIELLSVQGCLIAADYIPNSPDHRCISFAVQDVRIGN